MNLKQYYLTKNECYKRGVTMTVGGLMLHSTGANNPNLKRYVPNFDGTIGDNPNGNHWDQYRPGGRQVCVHGFIGKLADGSIATVQTLPWNMRGWHAGKSAGNNSYIGVEICEDNLKDKDYFTKVYNEAVELFAYLCKEFKLDPLTKIVCHCEGYDKGIASNHADVMHWFSKHGKTMNNFRNDVKKKMSGSTAKPETKPETKPESTFKSYTVKITADVLNVRNGPSTRYKVNTTVKKGEVYTIVDEKDGWGKLKSGAGWISLAYTNKSKAKPKGDTKPANKPAAKLPSVGCKVKIKSTAKKYCTGQEIPKSVKGKPYTVKQIGTSRYPKGLLLKEIVSWVNVSDVTVL